MASLPPAPSGQATSAAPGRAAAAAIDPALITGLVLAGGRGTRMGGVDKGLQLFRGIPLALHALRRLQPQVGQSIINANRHLDEYASFGIPVWADASPDYAGPLAGFITGLLHCATPYMVTVPCDTPMFPSDLVARLGRELLRDGNEIAMACAAQQDAQGQMVWRTEPVFCLLRVNLLASLLQFTRDGGRKIEQWTGRHKTVAVRFGQQGAFFNVNTLAELQGLQA